MAWNLKGTVLIACNCAYGGPCNYGLVFETSVFTVSDDVDCGHSGKNNRVRTLLLRP